jgi:hypothetical protein
MPDYCPEAFIEALDFLLTKEQEFQHSLYQLFGYPQEDL